MHVEPRVCLEPLHDGRGLVGSVVVADLVDVEFVEELGVDLDKELLELGGAVASVGTGSRSSIRRRC